MRFPQPLRRARLVRRYKRFLAEVVFDGEAGETTVHVPTPGAMLGLNEPGRVAWLSRSPVATRKLPWTLELVEADGGTPVVVNTQQPNRLVAEALAAGALPELAGYARVRPEVRYGEASRVDFLLEGPDRPPCWVEVKGVTLSRTPGLAEWPDCTSARATRHVAELLARRAAGERAVVLFVVGRGDCDRFDLAADLDPAFAGALGRAYRAGVEVLCYQWEAGAADLRLARSLPWSDHRARFEHSA